jgi:hypothetical protein
MGARTNGTQVLAVVALKGECVVQATAALLRSFGHHSMSHALLASLPEEAVTTN